GRAESQRPHSNDLEVFYPTSVLITGRDIIFLWVSRMVMTGMKFMGEKPFDDVIIHGTVLDKNGQRMSKTKINGIDPLSVFEKYGVDATRMALAGSATGIDFAWRDERVESFRNFANKIWNATRFCLMNSEGASIQSSPPCEGGVADASPDGVVLSAATTLADRWIVSRLNKTAKAVNRALETYQFHEAVQLLYHFFWDEFCDWYIELVKDEITSFDAEKNSPPVLGGVAAASADGVVSEARVVNPQSEARGRILIVLEQALRLLHPFMPFLTEELWLKLPGISNGLHNAAYASAEQTIMLTTFPTGDDSLIDEQAESEMAAVIELITKVRNIRAEMNIKSGDQLSIHVAADDVTRNVFAANEAQIKKLARADKIVLADSLDVPKASARAVLTGNAEIAVPLEGLIDFDKERARLRSQIEKLDVELQRLNAQLSNANFVGKAPKDKVDELRDRQIEIDVQTKTLSSNLEAIK
ncbi:MAG: class I tRNA ligase family protein, partial [Blastocatellia bacterium]|nr:class I tRNA ligase family protein [Blastocatellia bacterium]